MKVATICPSCDGADSLRQDLQVEVEGGRDIRFGARDGKTVVVFQPIELGFGEERITEEEPIRCTACGAEWDDADELLAASVVPREYVCPDPSCDWWGANDRQHAIEKPDCCGTVCDRDGDLVGAI